jgi:hypothetical protein
MTETLVCTAWRLLGAASVDRQNSDPSSTPEVGSVTRLAALGHLPHKGRVLVYTPPRRPHAESSLRRLAIRPHVAAGAGLVEDDVAVEPRIESCNCSTWLRPRAWISRLSIGETCGRELLKADLFSAPRQAVTLDIRCLASASVPEGIP